MLYAVSRNGVDFEKPALGKVFIDGANTNIYAGYVEGATPDAGNPWADIGTHSVAVVIDPTAPRAALSRALLARRRGTAAWIRVRLFSRRDQLGPPIRNGRASAPRAARPFGTSTISFDPTTKLFLQYTRHGGMHSAGIPSASPGGAYDEGARFGTYFPGHPDLMNKRRVFRTVSADFLNWSDLVAISTPMTRIDLRRRRLWSRPVPGGRDTFGTLGAFHYVDNEMDVRLIYSHDGVRWMPTDNSRPFLEPRREDHWDRRMVSIESGPRRQRVGDKWYYYHGGSRAHHDWWWAGPHELDHEEARDPGAHVEFGMGIAALRFEGMVSLMPFRPARPAGNPAADFEQAAA